MVNSNMNYLNIIDRMRLGLNYPKRNDLLYQNLKCSYENWSISSAAYLSPSFACRFSPSQLYSNLLAVANEDGHISIADTSTSKPRKQGFVAHSNAIFDITWAKTEPYIASAAGDNSVVIWDVSEGRNTAIYKFLGHTKSVKNVCCKPNGSNIFASGGRDGVICLWDCRSRPDGEHIPPDASIVNAHHTVPVKSGISKYRPITNHITALCFQDEYHLISGSTSDGTLKVWDLRKTYTVHQHNPTPRYKLKYPIGCVRNGYTDLVVSPCGLRLYASCNDGNIYCFNVGTYESNPICSYAGREISGFYIRIAVSPCGKYLASGSSNNLAYVWSIEDSYPVAVLEGHTSEVTCMDWCKNGKELKMASCSNDGCYRLWKFNRTEEDLKIKNRLIESKHKKIYSASHLHKYKPEIKKYLASPEPKVKRIKLSTPEKGQIEILTDSPTANLPNYVIDGTSPHDHVCNKKEKRKEKDWLTIIKQTTPGEKNPIKICTRRTSGPKNSKIKAKESLLKYFVIKKTKKVLEEVQRDGNVNDSCEDDPIPLPN